jgi:hypothetical protein
MKDTIEYFGECTAYSAKGHFKSADFRRILIYFLVFINIAFSVLSLLDIIGITTIKILGVISLLASFLILMCQTKDEADYISNSMKIGEEYLKLHNDIFILNSRGNLTLKEIEEIKDKVNKLNSKKKPSISFVGKYWAKRAIEKSGEMKTWWK